MVSNATVKFAQEALHSCDYIRSMIYIGGLVGHSQMDSYSDITLSSTQLIYSKYAAQNWVGGAVGMLVRSNITRTIADIDQSLEVLDNNNEFLYLTRLYQVLFVGGFVGSCHESLISYTSVRGKSVIHVSHEEFSNRTVLAGGFFGYANSELNRNLSLIYV